ncbi:MAG: hypothetical protein WBG01_00165 [Bacteroidota bacterium]
MKLRLGNCAAMLVAAGMLLVSGCDKNENPTDPFGGITENEAAELIASTLGGSQSTAGLTAQMEEVTYVAGGGPLPKISAGAIPAGTTFDTTIVRQLTGLFSYHYTFHYSYDFTTANTLRFAYSMRGTFDTPRVSSDDSANAVLDVSGIFSGQYLVFNGTYLRLGSQSIKTREDFSVDSEITVNLTNVNVDKATRMVQSGAATVGLTIEGSEGRSVSYVATLTFDGNFNATMVINGRSFVVNLQTGTAEPA